MPHHRPTPRRTLFFWTSKWSAAAIAALLTILWLVSSRVLIVWARPDGSQYILAEGEFTFVRLSPASAARNPVAPGLRIEDWHILGFKWWFFSVTTPSLRVVQVPLWAPAAGLLLLTSPIWLLDARARRRALAGCCTSCGYDLTGLPSAAAACPECGAPVVEGRR